MLVRIAGPFKLFEGAFREFTKNRGTNFRYLISKHKYLEALKKLFKNKQALTAYVHLKSYGNLPLKPPYPVELTRESYKNLLLLFKWLGTVWFDPIEPLVVLDGTNRIPRKTVRNSIKEFNGPIGKLVYNLSKIHGCHPAITSLVCHLCIIGDINRLRNRGTEPKYEQLLGGYRLNNKYKMYLRQIPITHLYINGRSYDTLTTQ